MTADTIFYPASRTKVAAAKAAIVRLVEKDQIALDHPVSDHWPEFARNGRAADIVSRWRSPAPRPQAVPR
jgi:CubicO group peptidase (beta-lactamase class C family)